jgi:heat-inducible transcriptional repressor
MEKQELRKERDFMGLSNRELAVLREIVSIYVHTGENVASRQVARCSQLSLSAATLRNVMAELEERGLLSRSHPSAGCIPTDAGFRAHVDSLGQVRGLPARTRKVLDERLSAVKREPMEDLEWVAHLVAEMTQEAGIAVRPMGEELTLEVISLVPLGNRRVLAVLVTQEGIIDNRVASMDEEWSGEEMQRIANYMNHYLHGRVLENVESCLERLQLNAGKHGDNESSQLSHQAGKVWTLFFSGRDGNEEVRVAGANNLLRADDFAKVERMRSVLAALDDRAGIVREWRRFFHKGRTQVIIGQESELTSSGKLGMVATLFYCDGRRAGALGAVGPRRMDYLRIVPMVEYIGDKLTRMLEQPGADYV